MWAPGPESMPAGPLPILEYPPHREEITVKDDVTDLPPMSVELNQ
jgi:hypothetical protein